MPTAPDIWNCDGHRATNVIRNLAAYAGVSQIPNPYGTDGFEAVYDLIDKACRNLAAKIQENLASSAL